VTALNVFLWHTCFQSTERIREVLQWCAT